MKICETCESLHSGKYGSGRFCSMSCSRSFSTKFKRFEINKKVSNSLRNKIKKTLELTCNYCQIQFTVRLNRKYAKYCSKKCSCGAAGKKIKSDTSKMGGLREGGGRSKQYEYINWLGEKMKLNLDEIELAKIFDILKLNWTRNLSIYFKYYTESQVLKKFYPDFLIKDSNVFIEYKGFVTSEMKHKMENSLIHNDFKLLIIYGRDKRYSKLGLNIDDLLKDHQILLDNLVM